MIKIISKIEFDTLMEKENINDQNVEEKLKDVDIAFISVTDTEGIYSIPWFNENHNNVLNLSFDDVSNDSELSPTNKIACKAFTIDQAKEILNFVNKNKDKRFIIHCAAGISRSGAIGSFINEYLEKDRTKFLKDNPYIMPNAHIERLLNSLIWNDKFA